jgi:hypothetical protein
MVSEMKKRKSVERGWGRGVDEAEPVGELGEAGRQMTTEVACAVISDAATAGGMATQRPTIP